MTIVKNVIDPNFSILPIVMFIWVVSILWLTKKLLNILKSRYPSKYKSLGEPSLFWNRSPSNSIKLFNFIFSPQGSQLNDKEITKILWEIRIVWILVGITSLAIFISMTLTP